MLDFETFVNRHGEYGAQALVEWLERSEGVRANGSTLLEERWNSLMSASPEQNQLAA